jgi:hypothetical protein
VVSLEFSRGLTRMNADLEETDQKINSTAFGIHTSLCFQRMVIPGT